MEKQEQLLPNPRRNILQMAVAGILDELGFGKADKECVESLTEVKFYSLHTNISDRITILSLFFFSLLDAPKL